MRFLLAGLLLGAVLAAPNDTYAQGAPKYETSKAAKSDRQRSFSAFIQDYEPDPAIWLVQDDDTKIYLFGTFHILPEGFRWRSARFDRVVADADELVLESVADDDEAVENALIERIVNSLGKGPRVSARLSPGNGPKWLALGKSAGIPPEYFDRLPPLMALFGLATGFTADRTGASPQFGVETVLEAEFRAAGKPVGSIENATEVLTSLLTIDDSLLLKDINRDLSRWDGKSLDTLLLMQAADDGREAEPLAEEHSWAQGHRIDESERPFGETAFGRVMERILLDDRNRAWAGWLERRLETPGTVLVAVGAAHLEGAQSVQVMLAERGLVAARLN